jgi:hypothetical protein
MHGSGSFQTLLHTYSLTAALLLGSIVVFLEAVCMEVPPPLQTVGPLENWRGRQTTPKKTVRSTGEPVLRTERSDAGCTHPTLTGCYRRRPAATQRPLALSVRRPREERVLSFPRLVKQTNSDQGRAPAVLPSEPVQKPRRVVPLPEGREGGSRQTLLSEQPTLFRARSRHFTWSTRQTAFCASRAEI